MSHMSELDAARAQGEKFTRHRCWTGKMVWLCLECLSRARKQRDIRHYRACPNLKCVQCGQTFTHHNANNTLCDACFARAETERAQ